MTSYDQDHYQPPAPVALLTLRALSGNDRIIADVPALIDTGADITLLPRWAIDQLGLAPQTDEAVRLTWFDGSIRSTDSVDLQVVFQGGKFQGRYALIDQPHGIVGRNILNHFRLIFDGPAKAWRRITNAE